MADIEALKAKVAEAYAAEEELLTERRSKRETLSKSAFRVYNTETASRQREVQAAINAAEAELAAALNNARQELYVGTVNETESQGGTSG